MSVLRKLSYKVVLQEYLRGIALKLLFRSGKSAGLRHALAFVLFLSLTWAPLASADEATTLLRGSVRAQDYLPANKNQGLKRQDLRHGNDAFEGEDRQTPSSVTQEFDAPAAAFDTPGMQLPVLPPPQRRNFDLRANMEGVPDFNGDALPGLPDQLTPPLNQQQPQFSMLPPEALPSYKPADPDASPEMQLAWDQWHRRVAEAIYQLFNAMAQLAFRYSRPLAAYVSYTVTRDGRVLNIRLQQKSPNVAFNAMILLVVNSISGQKELLAFPPGSHRMTVDKGGMFTQNYGQQGFKYVTGDRETVRAR